MKEVNKIHRDIYVGMVAEEMAQSGYYGEDVTVYGFIDYKTSLFHSFEREEACTSTYLQLLYQGQKLSQIESVHKRVTIKNKALTMVELDEKLQKKIINESRRIPEYSINFQIIQSYIQSLNKVDFNNKVDAIAGLLMLPGIKYEKEERKSLLALRNKFRQQNGNRYYYGFFVYDENDNWQMIDNGSLLVILNKWNYQVDVNKIITPILPMQLVSSQPIYYLKEAFEKKLQEVMDRKYLDMVEKLYRSKM